MGFHNNTPRSLKSSSNRDNTNYNRPTPERVLNTAGINHTDSSFGTNSSSNSSTRARTSTRTRKNIFTTPEKVDKVYVLAHQHEEDFHHRGKNVFARGLPPLTTQTRTAVYGPGAAQWKIDARNHKQALAAANAAAALPAQPTAPATSTSSRRPTTRPSRAASVLQQTSSPTPAARATVSSPASNTQKAPNTPAAPGVNRLSPSSPCRHTQEEIDSASFRTLDGARISFTRSDSSSLSSLSQSPELPTELEANFCAAGIPPRSPNSQPPTPTPANGMRGRDRSARIRDIEAQRAAQQAAEPASRPIAPLKKKRTPRPAPPPDPPTRLDDNGVPHRSDGHTMMREQFRFAFDPRANTAGGQFIRSEADYATPMRHQPEIARQALTRPSREGYTGPVAGQPTRIARAGGNEDLEIRKAQLSIGEALLAYLKKEAAAEAGGDGDCEVEGDSTLSNGDGMADEAENGAGEEQSKAGEASLMSEEELEEYDELVG